MRHNAQVVCILRWTFSFSLGSTLNPYEFGYCNFWKHINRHVKWSVIYTFCTRSRCTINIFNLTLVTYELWSYEPP